MNPCPCGYSGDTFKTCSCTPAQVQRYQSRISGPLLDRFDIQIEVPRLAEYEFEKVSKGESSTAIRVRVEKARELQRERYAGSAYYCNAHMSSKDVREYCQLDQFGRDLIKQAVQRFTLSARAYNRILKLARTIADLESSANIQLDHLAEAIQYRSLDRKGI